LIILKIKIWKIWVDKVGNHAIIHKEHGQLDGKHQHEKKEITIGRNIGRSNETTPFEQACKDAQSRWNQKKDKGYLTKGEESNTDVILPMLAEKYAKRKNSLVFPVTTQPKLNGIRCVVHTDLRYQSRLGKFWNTLDHLTDDLQKIIDIVNVPLDGEAYIHGLNLQDVGALIKKKREPGDTRVEGYITEDVEYWIFDTMEDDKFLTRYRHLYAAMASCGAKNDIETIEGLKILRLGKIVLVPITLAYDHDEIDKIHKVCISKEFSILPSSIS
jgi:cobalamin biosynthesis Mg chelatase CobN